MSKLNAGAFEFVPGRAFKVPTAAPAPSPGPPIERPEQTEAPAPAPTISLNIGGSKPLAPSPSQTPPPLKAPAAPKPETNVVKPSKAEPSRTFTTEKAKTDTSAIVQEVHAVADQTILEDLFGEGE